MAGIELDQMYETLKAVIADCDEKLDSRADAETAGKRKVTNELVEKFKGTWEPFVNAAKPQMEGMDEDTLVGVYHGILRAFREAFDQKTSKHVEELVASQPKVEPLITEAEEKEVAAQRSEAYAQLKHVIELAQAWNVEGSNSWEMPKPRRGSRGKRGKRALSNYDWFIDGEAVSEEDNSVAGVYKLLGFDKAAEFTEYLRSNKIDTRDPEEQFEVTYNGKTVRAVRRAGATTEETPEDENGEEEEDDNEYEDNISSEV